MFYGRPGDELTLKVAATGQGTVPACDLIVVSSWDKDKLVGVLIDRSIESFLKRLSLFGFLLVIFGASIFVVSRSGHYPTNRNLTRVN